MFFLFIYIRSTSFYFFKNCLKIILHFSQYSSISLIFNHSIYLPWKSSSPLLPTHIPSLTNTILLKNPLSLLLILSHLKSKQLIQNHFSISSPKSTTEIHTNLNLPLAPSMVPPKASKGKGKISEDSNAPDSDSEQFQPSLKQRRMMSSFKQRNVLLLKHGNIDTFPSSSFQFPAILQYQGVVDFISDSGMFYQDLVREFYAHFTILPGYAFSTTVRGTDIWKMLVLVLVYPLKAKGFRMDLLPTLRVGKISTTYGFTSV